MAYYRLPAIAVILAIALLAIAGLFLLMTGLAASETSPLAGHAPTPPTTARPSLTNNISDSPDHDEVVATVNGQAISQQAWRQATRLDAVMSQLAGQPLPTAEETLDRLINEIIVLDARRAPPFQSGGDEPDAAGIEARIQALETAWQISDDQVVAALTLAGLDRADLTARVGRLIQVEEALNQLAAQESDLDAWLAQARAAAEISLYRSLVSEDLALAGHPPPQEPERPASSLSPTPVPDFAPPPEMAISPYPQNAAPDFTLAQLSGESLTLSRLRGKPALINFWATWCPPCRRELPALQAAYAAHRAEIGFIAVNVKEDPATVTALAEELGLTFPILLDPDGQVSHIAYEVRGLPTTIFVDASGVVAVRHIGPLDEAAIEAYLQPLLEAKAKAEAETAEQDSLQNFTPSPQPQTQPSLAPDFTLTAATGQAISLPDYRGQSNVVLVFYRSHT